MRKYASYLIVLITFFISPLVLADVPTWQILTSESEITFTGIQNNSPVTGRFTKFSGIIKGDINQLKDSQVTLTIDVNSVSTSYKDLEDTLRTADWFGVDIFPTAVFEANQFVKIDEKNYQAKGKLTIRDKSLPLDVKLMLAEYSGNKARVTGSTKLKRSQFGVGRGEWGSLEEVKDEVNVNFTITAVKQP